MIVSYKPNARFTCNIPNTTYYTNGEIITITITPNEGYYFNLFSDLYYPYIMIDTERVEFDSLSDSECSITLETRGGQCTINGRGVLPYLANLNLQYATCNLSNERIYKHNETVDVVIKADDGYYFETEPTCGYAELTGNSDKTEYSGKLTFTNDVYVNATATVKPIEDKYGVCRIFTPTVDQIKQISEQRTYTLIGNGTTQTTQVDLGAFITNLYKVFIRLPADLTDEVILGGYETGVHCSVVLQDVVITDCGNVEIKPHYNNIMDYNNTDIEMYLPFIGFVSLETEKVMNRTLHLEYKTNVINGDTLACIYADNVLIQTHNCNVGYNIPYQMNNSVDKILGNVDIESGFLHGFTPYILIRRNKPANESDTHIKQRDSEMYCQVKDMKGLSTCSHVFNTLAISESERNMIDELLQQGVII